MRASLAEQVLSRLDKLTELYHRLVLVVAPSGSGKTKALQEVAERSGAPLVNVNRELSEHLLDFAERQRALRVADALDELMPPVAPVVLLDNIEVLFDVELKQDPLRLLQKLSRSRTIVASWNGRAEQGYLIYAEPEHPEYKRYPQENLVLISPEEEA